MLKLKELKIGNLTCDLTETYILGVVNITPDSFSDGGHFLNPDKALSHIEILIKEGADIIDIGAESSRPGSDPVSAEEEIQRLTPILKQYKKHFDTPLSLDTYKAETAAFGLSNGVDIINDISGLNLDSQMAETIGKYKAPLILMHMQGTPKSMQENPLYQNPLLEIKEELQFSITRALNAGIEDIIIDPGIGFGKTVEQNLTIIANLNEFQELGYPLLLGTSRKSFIGALTNTTPEERLSGTITSNVIGILNGAQFIRVHDVKVHKQAVIIAKALKRAKK